MGRLIDADALISKIKTLANYEYDDKRRQAFGQCYDYFLNAPTAYDLEKVVAELEEEKYTREEKFQYDTRTQEKMSSYNMGLNKAIDIVKKGGVE